MGRSGRDAVFELLPDIKNEYNIPVKFIGVGETADDIMEFDAKEFVSAIVGE